MMFIALLFQDRIGFDMGAILGYTTMVPAFLMVFVGVKSHRDNVASCSGTFGRAFKADLLITAVASVCYVATWEVIYYQSAPDLSDKYAAYAVEKARKAGATEAQLAEKWKQMSEFKEMYENPLMNIACTLLEPLPIGLLFSVVPAGVVSRKRRSGGATA